MAPVIKSCVTVSGSSKARLQMQRKQNTLRRNYRYDRILMVRGLVPWLQICRQDLVWGNEAEKHQILMNY